MKYDFMTPNTGGGVDAFAAMRGAVDPRIISFSVAEMHLPLAPEIQEAMHHVVDRGFFGYVPPDEKGFQRALVNWMKDRHHWDVEPAWVRMSPGVIPAIGAAIRALTEPGDGVLIQTPVYPHFFSEIRSCGRTVLENPLTLRDGRSVMDLEDLRKKADRAKVLLLCSPHNPVGRVWSRQELEALGEICLEKNLYVISDEIHFDLILSGEHTVFSQACPALRDRTVVCTAPSKTFNLAGCALSSIVMENPELRKRVVGEMDACFGMYVNTFAYGAAQAAYESGAPWLEALLEHLRKNHMLLKNRLQTVLPGAEVCPLEGTYLQWIDLTNTGLSPEALGEKLSAAQIYVSNGADFGTGGEGHIRFNLACPAASIEEALERLKKVL